MGEMSEGGAKKRKRIIPQPLAAAPEPPKADAQTAAAKAAGGFAAKAVEKDPADDPDWPAGEGERWATDSSGAWEVKMRSDDRGGSVAQCINHEGMHTGRLAWEYTVHVAVQRIAVDAGFAALATKKELHILSCSTGRLVLPPIVLKDCPSQLVINTTGHLLVVTHDAGLSVLDLNTNRSCARTSLLKICHPQDLEDLYMKSSTGEPVLKLCDGRLLLFSFRVQGWMTLSSPSFQVGLHGSSSSGLGAPQRRHEAMRLEGELLTAACLGDPEAFRQRLRELVAQCVASGAAAELGRLRSWLAALLGSSVGSATPWPWLVGELDAMQLNGEELLRDVVLPALAAASLSKGGAAVAQKFRAELEEVLQVPRAALERADCLERDVPERDAPAENAKQLPDLF